MNNYSRSFLFLSFFIFFAYSCQSDSNPEFLNPNGKLQLQVSKIELTTQAYPNQNLLEPSVPWYGQIYETGTAGEKFRWVNPKPFVEKASFQDSATSSLTFADGSIWLASHNWIIRYEPQIQLWQFIFSSFGLDDNILLGGKSSQDVWLRRNQNNLLHCDVVSCISVAPQIEPKNLFTHIWISNDSTWFFNQSEVYQYNGSSLILVDIKTQTQLNDFDIVGFWSSSGTDTQLILAEKYRIGNNTIPTGKLFSTTWDGTKFRKIDTTQGILPGADTLFSCNNASSISGFTACPMMVVSGSGLSTPWLIGYSTSSPDTELGLKMYRFVNAKWEELKNLPLGKVSILLSAREFNHQLWVSMDSFEAGKDQTQDFYRFDEIMGQPPSPTLVWSTFLNQAGLDQRYWVDAEGKVFALGPIFQPLENLYVSSNVDEYHYVWKVRDLHSYSIFPGTQNLVWAFDNFSNSLLKIDHKQTLWFTMKEQVTASWNSGVWGGFWFGLQGKGIQLYNWDGISFKSHFISDPNPNSSGTKEFKIVAIWGKDSSLSYQNLWAVAVPTEVNESNSYILHWNGEVWAVVYQADKKIESISGTGPNDVWFIAKNTLYHYDGFQLRKEKALAQWFSSVQQFIVWQKNCMLILDENNQLFLYDGANRSSLESLFGKYENVMALARKDSDEDSNDVWVSTSDALSTLSLNNGKCNGENVSLRKNLDLTALWKSAHRTSKGYWKVITNHGDDVWLYDNVRNYLLHKE